MEKIKKNVTLKTAGGNQKFICTDGIHFHLCKESTCHLYFLPFMVVIHTVVPLFMRAHTKPLLLFFRSLLWKEE